ncbi:hypothetical protein PtB15_13B446 [Puccinia triticina]|nr:hypothetical protein PtB15_13B446 [Puccinia triticina]
MSRQELFSLLFLLTLQSLACIVHCQSPCYIIGNKVLPKDVRPPPEVGCDGNNFVFTVIPDVTFNGLRFSQINFENRGIGVTPLGFAMATFSAGNGQVPEFLETAGKLYTAVNAALRSTGERNILKQLKVVDFFIASQIDANKGVNGQQGQKRNLKKVFTNCSKKNCTPGERGQIEVMINKL